MNAQQLIVSLIVVVSSAAAATQALASDGQTVYRCRVLGDSNACNDMPASPTSAEQRLVPGPIGTHLVHLGASIETAIAEARVRGEVPALQRLNPASTRLWTGAEAHERYLGNEVIEPAKLQANAAAATIGIAPRPREALLPSRPRATLDAPSVR